MREEPARSVDDVGRISCRETVMWSSRLWQDEKGWKRVATEVAAVVGSRVDRRESRCGERLWSEISAFGIMTWCVVNVVFTIIEPECTLGSGPALGVVVVI